MSEEIAPTEKQSSLTRCPIPEHLHWAASRCPTMLPAWLGGDARYITSTTIPVDGGTIAAFVSPTGG